MAENKIDQAQVVAFEHVDQVAASKGGDLGFDPRLEAGGSHHKSAAERRLALKADCLILPLAAMVFLIAYMVCIIKQLQGL